MKGSTAMAIVIGAVVLVGGGVAAFAFTRRPGGIAGTRERRDGSGNLKAYGGRSTSGFAGGLLDEVLGEGTEGAAGVVGTAMAEEGAKTLSSAAKFVGKHGMGVLSAARLLEESEPAIRARIQQAERAVRRTVTGVERGIRKRVQGLFR